MIVKALIFDFDGLIVDTETADFESWREVYAAHGATLALDDWVSCLGNAAGSFDPYAQLESVLGHVVNRAEIREKRRPRYAELAANLPLSPGVADYIAEANRLGLALAIASNSAEPEVATQLRRLGVAHYFDCVACTDGVRPGKPDPAVYVAALASLAVSAREAVAFEDSPSGVAAAQSAGIFCVAIPSPLTIGLDLSAANVVLDSLADVSLPELLSRIASHG